MAFERFRSRNRDEITDAQRIRPVRDSIDAALAGAQKELAGLQRRIDESTQAAAFLFGSSIDSSASESPQMDLRLKEAEQRIMTAEYRVKELTRQIQVLQVLSDESQALTPPG